MESKTSHADDMKTDGAASSEARLHQEWIPRGILEDDAEAVGGGEDRVEDQDRHCMGEGENKTGEWKQAIPVIQRTSH